MHQVFPMRCVSSPAIASRVPPRTAGRCVHHWTSPLPSRSQYNRLFKEHQVVSALNKKLLDEKQSLQEALRKATSIR